MTSLQSSVDLLIGKMTNLGVIVSSALAKPSEPVSFTYTPLCYIPTY